MRMVQIVKRIQQCWLSANNDPIRSPGSETSFLAQKGMENRAGQNLVAEFQQLTGRHGGMVSTIAALACFLLGAEGGDVAGHLCGNHAGGKGSFTHEVQGKNKGVE